MDEKKFRAVFREALVVDIDLSRWDERIRLVVVAREEVAAPEGSLAPIYTVDFVRTSELECKFGHLDIEWDIPERGHFQWNVYEVKLSRDHGKYTIILSSSSQLPIISVRCEDVEIAPIPKSLIDKVNPGWSKPGEALARPGLAELAVMPPYRGQRM